MTVWEIIGGAEKGGLLVRWGRHVSSPEATERLSTGALVEEINLAGERLHFRLLSGIGPSEGWISVTLKGKQLARRTTSNPEANSSEGKKGRQDASAGDSASKGEKWDPYQILGVPPDAVDAKIKSAYRKASLKVHPDRNPDPEAAAQFRELTKAKDFLLNPLKRMMYNMSQGYVVQRAYEAWWSSWDEIFEEIEADDEDTEPNETQQSNPLRFLPDTSLRVDLLVFGATGIVGTLACSMLQRLLPSCTWSIAGRDSRKLHLIEKKLARSPFYMGQFCISGQEDIEHAVRKARVVVDFSGPRFLIGDALASACVRVGTHYIDTTGFGGDVLASKEAFNDLGPKAKLAGVCLIFFCGIHLIQADFGSLLLVKHLREKHGMSTRYIDGYEGGFGTRLTGSAILSSKGSHDFEEQLRKVGYFFLGGLPSDGLQPEDDEDRVSPVEDQYARMWKSPAEIPEQTVVRCSYGLFKKEQPYGDRFRCRFWNLFPNEAAARVNPLREQNKFLRRGYEKHLSLKKIPGPGQGPCERFRKECAYTRILVAESEASSGKDAQKAYCVFNTGPGGLSDLQEGTALMALEAAKCMLAALNAGHSLRSGFGTPTYHLAHLGFAERLTTLFNHKLVDGTPSSTLFQNAFTSVAPLTD